MKKIVVFMLIIGILVSSFSFLASAESNSSAVPVIYIQGYGATIHADKDDQTSEVLWPIENLSFDYLLEKIDGLNPIFLKAYVTGDYTDYCNYIYDAYAPLFEKLKLNNNGEVEDNSGVYFPWRTQGLTDKKKNGGYDIYDYEYKYDWRRDPYELAQDLNEYVTAVKKVTGSDKFSFVSRCFGSNVVAAYIDLYGTDDIVKCLFNASGALSVYSIDMLFAGKIKIESEAMERYVYDLLTGGVINDFIKASVSLAEETYLIDGLSAFVDSVYVKVMDDLVPRLVTCSFGSFPGFWAMTNRHFEEAKELQFGDKIEEYAGMIEKIDRYHYSAQADLTNTIANTSDTTDYYFISKYGYQLMPVQEDADRVTDNCVLVEDSSFGATVVDNCTKHFSDDYVKKQTDAGLGKYISADHQIDASTCILPEKTWFIRNMQHQDFSDGQHNFLIRRMMFSDEPIDINSLEDLPQFLEYISDSDTFVPLTEENKDYSRWNNDGFFKVFINWCSKFKDFLVEYLIPILKEKMSESIPKIDTPMPY